MGHKELTVCSVFQFAEYQIASRYLTILFLKYFFSFPCLVNPILANKTECYKTSKWSILKCSLQCPKLPVALNLLWFKYNPKPILTVAHISLHIVKKKKRMENTSSVLAQETLGKVLSVFLLTGPSLLSAPDRSWATHGLQNCEFCQGPPVSFPPEQLCPSFLLLAIAGVLRKGSYESAQGKAMKTTLWRTEFQKLS